MQLANKWVLITGGSSGFGAAAAKSFGSLGCHVVLGARRQDRLKASAESALAAGAASAHFQTLDVGSTASVETFGQWLKSLTPRLDILINNAGGAHGLDTVANARDEDLEAMVQSNFLGVLRVTRCLIPMLPHHAGAWIINIGSIAGRTAYEGGAAYCGVKAAELKITQSLRLELNGTGIRVGTLDPGLAETEFSMVRFKGDQERARKVYEGTEPLVAQDIADALVFMATRPPHVCIDEMVIKPTDQAAIHKLYRRTTPR